MQDSQGIQDFYIKKMHIDKVRHLENIDIDIAGDTKRHLILTGKNGSGKTSLLLELNDVLFGARKPVGDNIFNFYYGSDEKSAILVLPNRPPIFKSKWDTFSISTDHRDCIFMLLPADRKLDLQLPKSIEAVDIANDDLRSDVLLKYLLYLNYQKMNALANDDEAEADKVQLWFDMFLSTLREIYECPELTLHHDSKDLSFKIVMPGREPFGFNEMADGYSAFLHIVIELMLRMENKASLTYDLPGIVLIDEIETHLHVKLQKKVLPFLTKMFPRIQFIVTTHSPFVITSLSDAVVYDLEKQISVEDMSAYSYEAVIEHYYDINMYSERADRQFETYKSLIAKENRSPEETEQLASAIAYLKQVPIGAAEEMVFAFREMEAQRRAKNGQNQ